MGVGGSWETENTFYFKAHSESEIVDCEVDSTTRHRNSTIAAQLYHRPRYWYELSSLLKYHEHFSMTPITDDQWTRFVCDCRCVCFRLVDRLGGASGRTHSRQVARNCRKIRLVRRAELFNQTGLFKVAYRNVNVERIDHTKESSRQGHDWREPEHNEQSQLQWSKEHTVSITCCQRRGKSARLWDVP